MNAFEHDPVYRKTDAGLDEMRERQLGLPRKTFSLLLAVDGQRTRAQLCNALSAFGDVAAQLDDLIGRGLIEDPFARAGMAEPGTTDGRDVPVAAASVPSPSAETEAPDDAKDEAVSIAGDPPPSEAGRTGPQADPTTTILSTTAIAVPFAQPPQPPASLPINPYDIVPPPDVTAPLPLPAAGAAAPRERIIASALRKSLQTIRGHLGPRDAQTTPLPPIETLRTASFDPPLWWQPTVAPAIENTIENTIEHAIEADPGTDADADADTDAALPDDDPIEDPAIRIDIAAYDVPPIGTAGLVRAQALMQQALTPETGLKSLDLRIAVEQCHHASELHALLPDYARALSRRMSASALRQHIVELLGLIGARRQTDPA